MAAANFYYGVTRGQEINPSEVVVGVASNGAASDVELRVQTNNGTSATGITKIDVLIALKALLAYFESDSFYAGNDLPAN